MTSLRRQQVIASLQDKESRDLYVDEHIGTGLAFQIRTMREDRGWSQSELGARTGKAQESISQLENPDYGKFTLKTLKRLASAFDVALIVRFAPFSELVDWTINLSPDDLAAPSFENDTRLKGQASDLMRTAITMPDIVVRQDRSMVELAREVSSGNLYDFATYRELRAGGGAAMLETATAGR